MTEATTEVEEIRIPNLVFIQAPSGFLERLSTQINRWFHIDAHPVWLMDRDMVVRVNDRVPPVWVDMFRSLAERDYKGASECLKSMRAMSADEHRIDARLMSSETRREIS